MCTSLIGMSRSGNRRLGVLSTKRDVQSIQIFVQFFYSTLGQKKCCKPQTDTGKMMDTVRSLVFPPFRFDLTIPCLYRETERIALRPKTLAVLSYLVDHPSHLVTTMELRAAVWPEIQVSAGVLRVCIRELRKALGDDAKAPQFIETVHRRGYRFIGQLTATEGPPHGPSRLVGREAELSQLDSWFKRALQGQRQIVFVTGEAGIGKTRLIDAFLERLAATDDVQIGQGHCVDQYGGGEAYLPVLGSLGAVGSRPWR